MSAASRLDGQSGSIALAVAVFGVLFPTLARSAQSGDGVELVRVALAGGVPHPTGFPLQAWLDRIAVLVPLVTPAFRLALLDLLAHAATVFVASEILRRLDVRFTGRAACAAAFAVFPPVWELAVVPEVFSIANLLVACLVLHLVVVSTRSDGSIGRKDAVWVGALVGLAAAQHPITLEAAPIFMTTAGLVLRRPEGRGVRLALMALSFALITLGLFASLPLLRSTSVWPDWGELSSAASVLEHALREEYGSFALTGAAPGRTIDGLEVFASDLARYAAVTVIIALIGGAVLMRRRHRRIVAVGVLGMVLAGLLVLLRARMPAELLAVGYLSKLDGPTVLGLAILGGFGVDAIQRQPGSWIPRRLLDGSVAALAVVSLGLGWSAADVSRDDTLDLVARGLSTELPRNAVYLAENDVESFMGVPTQGGVRYPISIGLLSRPWYIDTVAPHIEPRLKISETPEASAESIVEQALSDGLSVASTNEETVEGPGRKATLDGLLYITDGRDDPAYTAETAHAAIELCSVVDELPALPADGHVFSRHFFHRFSRAYAGAATFFEAEGKSPPAASARAVEHALNDGKNPEAWIEACKLLTEEIGSGPY
jgi:hypothetical protein